MRVFLSYSHRDQQLTHKLAADLRRYGYTVWIDERDLRVSNSLARGIRDGIDRSDYFLLVISESSNESFWVQAELHAALQAQARGELKGILPLLRGTKCLPSLLDGRVYADFSGEEYTRPFQAVLAALGHDLATVSVMASFASKKRRLAKLVPHLIEQLGFAVADEWRPVDLHLEICGGYLGYMRDQSTRGGGFTCHAPPSPLVLDPEVPPLDSGSVQIGFGHVRAHLLGGADVLGGIAMPNWKNLIHIAGLAPHVEKVVSHLTTCEHLGSDVRLDVADIHEWWKNPEIPQRDPVRVSGTVFHKDFVIKPIEE